MRKLKCPRCGWCDSYLVGETTKEELEKFKKIMTIVKRIILFNGGI